MFKKQNKYENKYESKKALTTKDNCCKINLLNVML